MICCWLNSQEALVFIPVTREVHAFDVMSGVSAV